MYFFLSGKFYDFKNIPIASVDEKIRDAIMSAKVMKELFYENTYGQNTTWSFEGKLEKYELCETDVGYMIKYTERMTAAEGNGRPATHIQEGCLFLEKDILDVDDITFENLGKYISNVVDGKIIVIVNAWGCF